MTIFTRVPLAYWTDRIGMPLLFSGIGTFLTILILVNSNGELALPETILSLLFSASLIIGGIIFYFRYPLPTRIEVDDREIRVFYTPNTIITISRKVIIGADGYSKGMHGGSGNAIYYESNRKLKGANIQGWYRKSNGTVLPRNEINTAINILLKIDINEVNARIAKLR